MTKSFSPLRYPGGKTKIYDKVRNIIEINNFSHRTYVEPFAGGFGIGIKLLKEGIVQSAILNDYDIHIFHFWDAVVNNTEELIKMIMDTPISLEERDRQKEIYKDLNTNALLDGFATLFLNRVNYSGVIKGGPIGGLKQDGKYKLNCRFNKVNVIKKIEDIAIMRNKIILRNNDANEFIIESVATNTRDLFFNIDPPYVVKGSQLYTNFFKEEDHRVLANTISRELHNIPWITTYDDCPLIRELYVDYYKKEYSIMHNAGGSVLGKELVITNLPNVEFEW